MKRLPFLTKNERRKAAARAQEQKEVDRIVAALAKDDPQVDRFSQKLKTFMSIDYGYQELRVISATRAFADGFDTWIKVSDGFKKWSKELENVGSVFGGSPLRSRTHA